MKHKVIITFLLLFLTLSYGQNTAVLISEVKKGKRTQLFAENTSADTLNVFLMVDPTGYRRRAVEPVVKNIPPGRKLPMITLIELADEPSSYTYEMVVNRKAKAIDAVSQVEAPDIEKLLRNKLVVFTKQNCEACDRLMGSLKDQRIGHTAFGIEENSVIYRQFMQHISGQLTVETKIRFPIVWNRDQVLFGYENIAELLKLLK